LGDFHFYIPVIDDRDNVTHLYNYANLRELQKEKRLQIRSRLLS